MGIALVITGLVLEIVGVFALAVGEILHELAFARYLSTGEGRDSWLAGLPRWSRPFLRRAVKLLAPKDVMAMNAPAPLKKLAIKLLGYAMIAVGFILQAAGTWWAARGRG